MPGVEFDEHALLRQTADGGGNADARGEIDAQAAAHFLHVDGFDDAECDGARDALPQVGGIVGKVEVGVAHLAGIVGTAHVGIDTEGQTAVDGPGCSQLAIATGADGGPCHDVHLERSPLFMLPACLGGQSGRYDLGGSGRAESAHGDVVAMTDLFGGLCGGDFGYRHRWEWVMSSCC